jgi:hypothetical protein
MVDERTCDDWQELASMRLDGEPVDEQALDEHLAACDRCRSFADGARTLRQQLRYESLDALPDLTPSIRDELAAIAPTGRTRRGRLLGAAAAFVAGALVGALLVSDDGTQPGPVAAASIPEQVVAAQGELTGARAELEVVEWGWHPDVPERRWDGILVWSAPEALSLSLTDRTPYPSDDWIADDVEVIVADDERWTVGPRDCPVAAQPTCTPAEIRVEHTTGREPFAEGSPGPLDLVLPVKSFAGAAEPVALGEREVAGRIAVGVRVTAAQGQPVLDGLTPAGNGRDVHPTDDVDLWLDAETMMPLAITVTASDAAGRSTWAANRGYTDEPGERILELTVTQVTYDEPPSTPARPDRTATVERGAGFSDGPVDPAWTSAMVPPAFDIHRTGTLDDGGPAVEVVTWSDGRAWIKLRATREWSGTRLFGDLGAAVRTIVHGDDVVYANDRGDEIALHGDGIDVVVSGTADESTLLAVATSVGVEGRPMPDDWDQAATVDLAGAVAAQPALLVPHGLPGFGEPVRRVDPPSVSTIVAGAGARSFRLVQTDEVRLSPPLDVSVVGVEVRGTAGRWSDARGELEWVEVDPSGRASVVSLRSTTLGLDELLTIAERLRPA